MKNKLILFGIIAYLAIAYICISNKNIATAWAQSDTCADGQTLIIDTVNKRYKCITTGGLGSSGNVNMTVPNASSTGTTVNRFAKLTGAPSTAVITSTSDTEGAMGIVTSGAGTTGSATIALLGKVDCEFDNATTANNYVVISAITAGMCHDNGNSFPIDKAAYGRVLTTNGSAGTYTVQLMTPDLAFQNGGNGKSRPATPTDFFQYNSSNNFGAGALAFVAANTAIVRSAAGSGVGSTQHFFIAREFTNNSAFHGLRLSCGSSTCDIAVSDQGFSLSGVDVNFGTGGNIFFYAGGAQRWSLNSSGHLVPQGSDGAFDLGSTTRHVRNVYFTNLISNSNEKMWGGGAPSISGDGTLNTGSKDSAGKVTSTTTGAASIVLTFSAVFQNAPACYANNETTANLARAISTTSQVTIAGTTVTSDVISYVCIGY